MNDAEAVPLNDDEDLSLPFIRHDSIHVHDSVAYRGNRLPAEDDSEQFEVRAEVEVPIDAR